MSMWIRTRRRYASVTATVALVVALGGSAYAATSGSFIGSNGAINGCVPKHGGTLKVLKPSRRCPKHTVALSFSAKGPVGAAGLNGSPGSAGAAGSTGPTGALGPTVGNASGSVNPPANPISPIVAKETTVTTTVPGALYVSGSITASVTNCTTSPGCVFNFGLYVDGTPVPGTEVQVGVPDVVTTGIGFASASTVGIVTGVSPGVHTIDFEETSGSSAFGVFNYTGATAGAILLGS